MQVAPTFPVGDETVGRITPAATMALFSGSRGVRMIRRGRRRGRGSGGGVNSDGEVYQVGGRATRSEMIKSQSCQPVPLVMMVARRKWKVPELPCVVVDGDKGNCCGSVSRAVTMR